MSRRCALTGKGVLAGNNVSHANNKTRRRFLPNLQNYSFTSEAMGNVKLRVTPRTMKTIENNGGLDAFLLSRSNLKLTDEGRLLKRRLRKAIQGKAA